MVSTEVIIKGLDLNNLRIDIVKKDVGSKFSYWKQITSTGLEGYDVKFLLNGEWSDPLSEGVHETSTKKVMKYVFQYEITLKKGVYKVSKLGVSEVDERVILVGIDSVEVFKEVSEKKVFLPILKWVKYESRKKVPHVITGDTIMHEHPHDSIIEDKDLLIMSYDKIDGKYMNLYVTYRVDESNVFTYIYRKASLYN